jgi:hypothetical protein
METDDDFDSAEYDIDYRSENHNLSKYLKLSFQSGAKRDVHIDSITQSQPRLWAAKQAVLKIMDDYNATFILGAVFPAVWFVLTLSPTGHPGAGMRRSYTVATRSVPKTVVTSATSIAMRLVKQLRQLGKRVVVNIGGTGEVKDAINLNPNKVAPRKDIPHLVAEGAERIGEIFEPNAIDEIVSNRLPPNTIRWQMVLPGAHRVLKPGGSISIRFQGVGKDGPVIIQEMRRLGFTKINNPMDMGAVIEATK